MDSDNGGNSYSQSVNQNFNSSYSYSTNANIYSGSNFISNSSANYMMPPTLHENASDYLDSNFLLPSTTPLLTEGSKSHNPHQSYGSGKNQACDKRLYLGQQKRSRSRKNDTQNFEFPISGISSPLDDYHHAPSFLTPNPLYQNQTNAYPKTTLPPPTVPIASSTSASLVTSQQITSNPMAMTQHHPQSGTSLTNFNLSTIFPEINDKVSQTLIFDLIYRNTCSFY